MIQKKFQYNKIKQAKAREHPPYWTKDTSKYTRSQEIFGCNKCGDTSFELIEDDHPTGRCCRCGEKFK